MHVDKDEVLKRFEPRKLDAQQIGQVEQIREGFKTLVGLVLAAVPPGRSQAIALTHLEEASFNSVAGIARRDG